MAKSPREAAMASTTAVLSAGRHRNENESAKGTQDVPSPSGQQVTVNRGEFIGYRPNQGGTATQGGGWFACSKDDDVGPEMTVISVVNKRFKYDKSIGSAYPRPHQRAYKKYWKDPDKKTIVSDGLPITNDVLRRRGLKSDDPELN